MQKTGRKKCILANRRKGEAGMFHQEEDWTACELTVDELRESVLGLGRDDLEKFDEWLEQSPFTHSSAAGVHLIFPSGRAGLDRLGCPKKIQKRLLPVLSRSPQRRMLLDPVLQSLIPINAFVPSC